MTTQRTPNPNHHTIRPTCSGPSCPAWSPKQGGWCTITRQTGQRTETGDLRECIPARTLPLQSHPRVPVRVQVLPHGRALGLPDYATPGASGMDGRAAFGCESVVLEPGCTVLIPLGFRASIPPGYELQVRPRSGLARRFRITIPNSPGTIDADYRGEVKVLMRNDSKLPYSIERGQRICQLVLVPVYQVEWQPVASLDETARGDGGFGSTGVQ